MFSQIRGRARRSGIPFSVTALDLSSQINAQNWVCARTGIPFDLTIGSGRLPFGPSVDRIDNALGYEPDNIQIVCNIYNFGKNVFTDADMLKFAHALLDHDPTINKIKLKVVAQ